MTLFHRIIAAAIVAAQLGVMRTVVFAQQNTDKEKGCFDSRFDNPNATTSYSVPGFAPPGSTSSSSSNSTWTFSTGAVNYGGNTTQRFWVNTSPPIEVNSDSLPYQGCILAFVSLNKKVPVEKQQDKDGDCTSALGEKCVAAILKNANEIGRNLSANMDEDSYRYNRLRGLKFALSVAQCSDFIFNGIPTECGEIRFQGPDYSDPVIGHSPKVYNNDTLARERGLSEPSKCPNVGTNGTGATSPLFEIHPIPAPSSPRIFNSSYNTYDQWLNHVLPVLIPVWSKDPKQVWSDSRLICMRPEAVKQESGSESGNGNGNATSTQQSSGSTAQPSAPTHTGLGVRVVDGSSRGTTIGSIFFIIALLMMII